MDNMTLDRSTHIRIEMVSTLIWVERDNVYPSILNIVFALPARSYPAVLITPVITNAVMTV
jgi:hypothetical protein